MRRSRALRERTRYLLVVACLAAIAGLATHAKGLDYRVVPAWPTLPPGRVHIGSMHGDVAVSSNGEVYISVLNMDGANRPIADPLSGLQVYAPDGRYLRNVPGAPKDMHGFIIRRESAGEFIYTVNLTQDPALLYPAPVPGIPLPVQTPDAPVIIKMTLDGQRVLTIPVSAIPDAFKTVGVGSERGPQPAAKLVSLTSVAVAPNGDIYAADGYASDYIHRFDRTGKYLASFGGHKAPYNFNILHKLVIDTRFTPPRILATDRNNDRMVHLSLDGQLLGDVGTGLKSPAAVVLSGDDAVIGEYDGRVSVLDKAGLTVATFGGRPAGEPAADGRETEPSQWRDGILLTPHGIAVNAQGDVFVSEFNIFGRLVRFNRQ